MTESTIIYTHTDEAPLLATYSFLPIISAYASTAGVALETRDISLAGLDAEERRLLASSPLKKSVLAGIQYQCEVSTAHS